MPCKTFYIDDMVLSHPCVVPRKELDEAWNYVKDTDIKYGDLVVFTKYAGYRNEGVVIFDGKRLVRLYFKVEEDGSIPPKFKVLQKNKYGVDIGLYHWHDGDGTPRDGHFMQNYTVWFDQTKHAKELIKNLTYDTDLFGIYALYSYLTNYDGQRIYIVVIFQYSVKDESYVDSGTYELKENYLEQVSNAATKIFRKKGIDYDCVDDYVYTDAYVTYPNNSCDKTILYTRIKSL